MVIRLYSKIGLHPFENRIIFSERACNSKIVETDTNIDNLVSKLLTKVSAFIFDNSTSFDTANGMFNANSNT